MIIIFLISISTWLTTRDRIPETIRIAATQKRGLYYKLAESIKPYLEKKTGMRVEVLATNGSMQNRQLLLDNKADLAVTTEEFLPQHSLYEITPLYNEVVHVVVRKSSSIYVMEDLKNKNISIGIKGSGMRSTAQKILDHYEVILNTSVFMEDYFTALGKDSTLDAAIVTTGHLNPDLDEFLNTGDYRLLSLDAEGIVLHNPNFNIIQIPKGLFSGGPSIPQSSVSTVATTAMFIAREDVSNLLIKSLLEVIYTNEIRNEIPILISKEDAKRWPFLHRHEAAVKYFDPYGGVNVLSNLIHYMVEAKELFAALGSFIYLLWTLIKRQKEKKQQAQLNREKERLEFFLKQTLEVEIAQIETKNVKELKDYLDQVTKIKLQALEELTHEGVQGDRMFSIFLMQCANLINKIQAKILYK